MFLHSPSLSFTLSLLSVEKDNMLAPCSFSSERLVYRAFTFPDDDAFLLDLVRDEATQMGWFGGITRPHSLTMLESFKKFLETAPLA